MSDLLRPVPLPAPPDTDEPAMAFVLRLARALHTNGWPADNLEEALRRAAERLGLHGAQFFSTPTSIMAAFGRDVHQRTFLLRVDPAEIDLGRLARVERVARRVADGLLTPEGGLTELDAIAARPAPYGAALTLAAFGAVSASVSTFLGGGPRELLASGGVGLVTGLLALLIGIVPAFGRLFEPLSAFAATALATLLAARLGNLSAYTVTVSGLVVLLPGLMLTTALTELATRHLASGTARLAGAAVIFLGIAFGVAMGNEVAARLVGDVPTVRPTGLPDAWVIAAILPAALGLLVILKADWRDAPWVIGAIALAFLSGRAATRAFGLELGLFLGAFVVGVASNLSGWLTGKPRFTLLVPGLLILVPGTFGFRSLSLLMDRNVVSGIEAAFTMVLAAIALVAGVLLANELAPMRPARRA